MNQWDLAVRGRNFHWFISVYTVYTDWISGILIAENQRTFADLNLESKGQILH